MNALEIKNLSVSFSMYDRGLQKRDLRVISNLGIDVREGEILAIAGSSGSGKSLLAHAIFGILPKNATLTGEMKWFGEPLTSDMRARLRGRELALVPQSVEFLDPLKRVGKQVSSNPEVVQKVFARYGLDAATARLYPHQLSGGMARRVLVCTAVVGGAKVIVADEPTPGLSSELAKTAMGHFRELADAGVAILLITHDLGLALSYADRIAIFYAGTTVESTQASDFSDANLLRHPYSKALWHAMPRNDFRATPGNQPYAASLPVGCPYAPRCELKTAQCDETMPPARVVRGGEVSCFHAS